MAGFDLPVRAVREQLASALDLIIHLARLKDGTRRVTQVTEVGHMEGEVILLQDIFVFDFRMGTDAVGRSLGQLKATGLRPHFTERLADRGVKVDTAIFEPGAEPRMADHWPEFVAWPVGLASMTAPAAGWSHTILVHLHRLRSPWAWHCSSPRSVFC